MSRLAVATTGCWSSSSRATRAQARAAVELLGPDRVPPLLPTTTTTSCRPARRAARYRADSDFELRRGRCGGALGVRAARKSWWANNYCSVSHRPLAALAAAAALQRHQDLQRQSEPQTGGTCIVTTDLWNENPLDNWELGRDRPAINNFRIDLLLFVQSEN